MRHVEMIPNEALRIRALAVRIGHHHKLSKRAKLYLDKGYSIERVMQITGIDEETAKALKK